MMMFQRWADTTAVEEWEEYCDERWPWMPRSVRGFLFVKLGCRA